MGKSKRDVIHDMLIRDTPLTEPMPVTNRWLPHAEACASLVKEKNEAYGSSWDASGQFLSLLYPDGMKPEQYQDALVLARMFDKMMRVAHDAGAFGESPYKDLMGYALLAVERAERK
jgi:hypothetical protein